MDELHAHAGEKIGASRWQPVTHDDMNRSAEATGDQQWMHTDVAARARPFRRQDLARVLPALARTQAPGRTGQLRALRLRHALRTQSGPIPQPSRSATKCACAHASNPWSR